MLMKRNLLAIAYGLILVSSLFVAVAGGTVDDNFPTGRYRDGGFVAVFTSDGHLIIKDGDSIKAEAIYKTEGDQIIFEDNNGRGQCSGAGKYKWSFDGAALTFTLLEDECSGRVRHLTQRSWPKLKKDE